MSYVFIVGSKVQEQLFILPQKRSGIDTTFIPQEYEPSTRFEDARKLPSRSGTIEPVRRLRRSYEINALIPKSCSLGCPGYAGEIGELPEQPFSRYSHIRVGLNTKHSVPILEQQARPYACPGRNVRHEMIRPQTAFCPKRRQGFRRVSRSVTYIVINAI